MEFTCDSCMERISGKGVVFCPSCAKYLCEECSKVIHRFKTFRDHEIETIDTSGNSENSNSSNSDTSSELCPHHNNMLLRLFCEDCKELCCYQCICNDGKHAQHKVTPFRDAYDEKKSSTDGACKALLSLLDVSSLDKELLENEIKVCKSNKAEVDKEIAESFEHVTKAVHDRSAELKEQLSSKTSTENEETNALIAHVKKLRADLDDAIAKLSAKSSEGIEDMFLVAKETGRIEKIAAELKAANAKLLDKVVSNAKTIEFIPEASVPGTVASTEDFVKRIKTFGTLKTTNSSVTPAQSAFTVVFLRKPGESSGDGGEKRGKNYLVKWGDTIAQSLTDLVRLNEDTVFVLELKSWNEPSEEAKAEFSEIYRGKGSEYTISDYKFRHGKLRLWVGVNGSSYRVWESAPKYVNSSGGTYEGAFRPNGIATFADSRNRIVQSASVSAGSRRVTAIGTEPLGRGLVSVFFIRVISTKAADNGTSVGVAPIDTPIVPNQETRDKYGWYMNFFNTRLFSGPPQRFSAVNYGNRNDIRNGDIIRVKFDATGPLGVLSFAINGVDLGVAYRDIPLDKEVAPAVFIYGTRETIELCDQDLELPEEWNALN